MEGIDSVDVYLLCYFPHMFRIMMLLLRRREEQKKKNLFKKSIYLPYLGTTHLI